MSRVDNPLLILLRHAKSDWTEGLTDFDRPLSKRGRKAAPGVGKWLRKHVRLPDLVISSPALRARETVLAVIEALGIDEKKVIFEPRIYEAGPARLIAVLQEHAALAHCTLLTGHNPGMEDLLLHLSADEPPRNDEGKLLTAGAAAVFRLAAPGDYGQGSAKLERLRRPRDAE